MQEYEKQKARDESQFKKFEDMVKQENEEQEVKRQKLEEQLQQQAVRDKIIIAIPLILWIFMILYNNDVLPKWGGEQVDVPGAHSQHPDDM